MLVEWLVFTPLTEQINSLIVVLCTAGVLTQKDKDPRGEIWEVATGKADVDAVLIRTNASFLRGGHYHDAAETYILLYGKVTFRYLVEEMELSKTLSRPGEMFTMPPRAPHLMLSDEDSLVYSFKKLGPSTDYPEYRKVVLDKVAAASSGIHSNPHGDWPHSRHQPASQ